MQKENEISNPGLLVPRLRARCQISVSNSWIRLSYDLKKYGDGGGGGVLSAEADNTLRDLHNSSNHAKAESNN